MGVFLCLGKSIHEVSIDDAVPYSFFNTFESIHEYLTLNDHVLIQLGEGMHKIKKKAEQMACEQVINKLM